MSNAITWTKTDESPELSAKSLLPIMRHFSAAADVEIRTLDISLAGRLLQAFPENLRDDQKISSGMEDLSKLVQEPDARIIKLPNASATVNQLKVAVDELRENGFDIPPYPENPTTEEERAIQARYDAQAGSVVNPPLRQGNAVRSIPEDVKNAAKAAPHAMGQWRKDSQTRVEHMAKGDFYDTEKSFALDASQSGAAHIRFTGDDGQVIVLKSDVELDAQDIIDTGVMVRDDLQDFLTDIMRKAKQEELPLSLHLKATMMKKVDGVAFGDALREYLRPVYEVYGDVLDDLGVDPKNGMDELLAKVETIKGVQKDPIKDAIAMAMREAPQLAAVDAKAGTHHLSSPNNVIADVSLANLARWGGEVQDSDGKYRDTLAVVPDSTYARMHQAGVEFLKEKGSADPAKLGTVTTVRLQAEGAEEYGSKDTTFEAPNAGTIELITAQGEVLDSRTVKEGDIWRMSRTTNRAVENWMDIALERAQNSADPVVFWLDKDRPHDAQIIALLEAHKTDDNAQVFDNIKVLSPADAMTYTLSRAFDGQDTTCVTGNLIGDHITDYFPILEIGSSSKMLSEIKLLNGGLVAETGSGGTAPDLLSMVAEKNHFLWDDMGTAFAFSAALRHLSESCENVKAEIVADALDKAAKRYIVDERSPHPNGLDNRESHFFLAKYWAQEMAAQKRDAEIASDFAVLADDLERSEEHILAELRASRGQSVDTQGRYAPDEDAVQSIMRPSETLNTLLPGHNF